MTVLHVSPGNHVRANALLLEPQHTWDTNKGVQNLPIMQHATEGQTSPAAMSALTFKAWPSKSAATEATTGI